MKDVVKKIQVIIICSMVLAPVIILLFFSKQIYALNENRKLEEFPSTSWVDFFMGDGEYGSKLEKYFNDRFQFRDLFIRTKGELRFRVFNVTGSNGVYVGEDGYMYYKSVVEREQIANENLSYDYICSISESYENLKKYINSYGAEFLFMIPPQKNTVFPERTPKFNVTRKSPNQYEILTDMLSMSDVSDDFIDVVPILREAEKNYPTYYKTDFHWNGYGGTAAFTAAVNILADRGHLDGKVFDESMYEVYFNSEFRGGQLNNLPILEDWKENAVFTRKIASNTIQVCPDRETDNEAIHYVNSNPSAPLEKALLIGDSYTEYMISSESGILDCFKEVYFVHVDNSEHVINNYIGKVDYIIFERIESGIGTLGELINQLF